MESSSWSVLDLQDGILQRAIMKLDALRCGLPPDVSYRPKDQESIMKSDALRCGLPPDVSYRLKDQESIMKFDALAAA